MNYVSLFALCSLMVLIPSCGGNKGGSGTTTTQTEVLVEPTTEGTTVEVQEDVVGTEPAKATDKENLEEAELTEVVAKK